MIENKDLPQEYVSIRQIWLRQIDRCTEAISHRYMKDVADDRSRESGGATVVESIIALHHTLVDYGDATIRSDVDKWKKEKLTKTSPDDTPHSRVYKYQQLFDYIIKTLNRYGMLFDSSPAGYTNTEMRSI